GRGGSERRAAEGRAGEQPRLGSQGGRERGVASSALLTTLSMWRTSIYYRCWPGLVLRLPFASGYGRCYRSSVAVVILRGGAVVARFTNESGTRRGVAFGVEPSIAWMS